MNMTCLSCGDTMMTDDAAIAHEAGEYLDGEELAEWLDEGHGFDWEGER